MGLQVEGRHVPFVTRPLALGARHPNYSAVGRQHLVSAAGQLVDRDDLRVVSSDIVGSMAVRLAPSMSGERAMHQRVI